MSKVKKYGFVYLWRDKKHNRYYIGCHWGTENDGYICSSTWMKNSYKRRPNDFKRRILSNNIDSKLLLVEKEYKYLQLIKKEELGKKYYNLKKTKYLYSKNKIKRVMTLEQKQKISDAQKGKTYEERMGKEKADYVKNLSRERWKTQNPTILSGGIKPESIIKRTEKRAMLWQITDPEGNIKIIKNLTIFCKVNKLIPSHMKYKIHKGWTAIHYPPLPEGQTRILKDNRNKN